MGEPIKLWLIPLYWILGPAAVTLLFLMFLWGFVKLVVTIFMWDFTMYRMRGAGVWILGAVWSLLFQLLITPFKRASGKAVGIANQVGTEMECQAHLEDKNAGGSPTTALEKLVDCGRSYLPLNPSFLNVNERTAMNRI